MPGTGGHSQGDEAEKDQEEVALPHSLGRVHLPISEKVKSGHIMFDTQRFESGSHGKEHLH